MACWVNSFCLLFLLSEPFFVGSLPARLWILRNLAWHSLLLTKSGFYLPIPYRATIYYTIPLPTPSKTCALHHEHGGYGVIRGLLSWCGLEHIAFLLPLGLAGPFTTAPSAAAPAVPLPADNTLSTQASMEEWKRREILLLFCLPLSLF